MSPTFVAGIVAAAVVTGAAAVYCPVPWSPFLLVAAGATAAAAWRSKTGAVKLILANCAAAIVALALFEGYLGHRALADDGMRMEGTITENFTIPDDNLGYVPRKGVRVTSRKFEGEAMVYDVAYSIGGDGLRVLPAARAAADGRCVVFFGDSVTFGEGVNDDEAYANVVAGALAGTYDVRNFAFSGYGPHQMLAALQQGIVQSVANCHPVHFVYLAILEHINRVAGLAFWDRHGPRYSLGAAGTVARNGNFDSPRTLFGSWAVPPWVTDLTGKFYAWHRFFGRSREPRDADLRLFLSVVVESSRLVRANFPGADFRVVLWDGRDDPRLGIIEHELVAQGVPVYRLTAAIPDFAANSTRYLLSPTDGHPNALMHRRLAEYISSQVVSR